MGYMGIEQELKIDLIVDEIVGCENDQFTYEGVKFDSNSIITEDTIKELARVLKREYPQAVNTNIWFPARFIIGSPKKLSLSDTVKKVIAEGNWIGRERFYSYSESDCQEIVLRCAKAIKKRLDRYAKGYIVRYKVFGNGEVGFRYE